MKLKVVQSSCAIFHKELGREMIKECPNLNILYLSPTDLDGLRFDEDDYEDPFWNVEIHSVEELRNTNVVIGTDGTDTIIVGVMDQ